MHARPNPHRPVSALRVSTVEWAAGENALQQSITNSLTAAATHRRIVSLRPKALSAAAVMMAMMVKPGQKLAALEDLRETAACEKELTRQFTVWQKEFPELPEHLK